VTNKGCFEKIYFWWHYY